MTLQITPLLTNTLPALQTLWNRQLAPHTNDVLAHDMQDAARGYGRHAVVAWRGEQPVGCAGWVTVGIAADGCAYGAPVVAADVEVAAKIIQSVIDAVRPAGARRLRISARAPEFAKHEALMGAGFAPLFEFVNFTLSLTRISAPALPSRLHAVSFDQVNWRQAHACFADTFSDVPNSPIPGQDAMREEWARGDWDAGRILSDEHGEYQAFLLICANHVDAVGVRAGWRGRNVAVTLYQIAAAPWLKRDNANCARWWRAAILPRCACIRNSALSKRNHAGSFTKSICSRHRIERGFPTLLRLASELRTTMRATLYSHRDLHQSMQFLTAPADRIQSLITHRSCRSLPCPSLCPSA